MYYKITYLFVIEKLLPILQDKLNHTIHHHYFSQEYLSLTKSCDKIY